MLNSLFWIMLYNLLLSFIVYNPNVFISLFSCISLFMITCIPLYYVLNASYWSLSLCGLLFCKPKHCKTYTNHVHGLINYTTMQVSFLFYF